MFCPEWGQKKVSAHALLLFSDIMSMASQDILESKDSVWYYNKRTHLNSFSNKLSKLLLSRKKTRFLLILC